MIDFNEAKKYKGKKIKIKFTKEHLKYLEDNKEYLEELDRWRDIAFREIGFFEKHGLEGQKDVDFSTGLVTDVGEDVDYEINEDGEEFFFIELDEYKWVNIKDIESIEIID